MHKLILTLCLVVNVAIGARSKSPLTTLPVFIYGKDEAAIEVVEFCSMYCPACTYFKERTFPSLEQQYIATGHVRWIRIPFPIDYGDILMLTYLKHMPNDQKKPAYEWYESFREDTTFANEDAFHERLLDGLKQAFPQMTNIQRASPDEIDGILQETIRLVEQYKLKDYPSFLIEGQVVTVSKINDALKVRINRPTHHRHYQGKHDTERN